MRFCFFVTLFVISFQAEKADAMNIQCRFYDAFWGYGYKNGCDVRSVTLSSPEDREITSVNGDYGKTYDDVWWFSSFSKTFNNFPKNIKKFFPNVEAVVIHIANITTLTKPDMASLGPQLRRFDFYGNNIEVLEKGLFDENPNLEFINLSSNKIKFVASGVFDKLPKLKSFYFGDNTCHNNNARNDRAAVLNMIKQIEGDCQDVQTTTTTTTEKVKTEHELRMEELTAENAELKRQQLASDKKHQEELQNHKTEASLKDLQNTARIEQLEMQNEALKKEVAAIKPCELNEVRDSLMSKFKELKKDLESKFEATHDRIDTANKKIDAKLDSTLVKPMSSLHAKMDKMDLKLDSSDENFAFLNATCNGLDYKLNALECIRQP